MKRTNLTKVALLTAGLLTTATPLSAQQRGMGMDGMPMERGMMMRMMGDCPMMGMMMGADTSTFAEGRIPSSRPNLPSPMPRRPHGTPTLRR